ncbi:MULTISPECIES: LysR family transcriptional regulator [Rhizobium/Agrobacterium group]|uniref:HTH-type transcriptional regulator TtuA n=1 Tax=Rhizobium rhizogenes TaxID=359 RepID=A0A546X3L9_RHIRH|nr:MULTISPECIES: LysR family transcriptional regulator [Rhizobium/Agrobacterium group]TRA95274.1 LysR family transcriptional regulator [Rhizobium rhizogenes]
MNIRFLETVVWLAELKNFRVTADRMNITPAAISNRISAIEQELGVRLFDRDTRDVHLTREGKAFVSGARDIIARYNQLVSEIAPPLSTEGTVRIGVLPSMAMTILPRIMEVLRTRFPRIRIYVTTDSSQVILDKLEQREVDIILGFHGTDVSLYRITELCNFGMFWIAKGKFKDADVAWTRSDLLMHPIISYEAGTRNHRRLIEYLPENSFEDNVIHYSNSLGTTINMVAAGIGISVLPPIVIQNELRTGLLKVLNVQQTFPPTEYFAVYLANSPSRLASLVASIADDAASEFCALYDNALAAKA